MTVTAPDDRSLWSLAGRLADKLLSEGRTVATAESCTGGWIAKILTDLPGSSDWFGYGWISYSNAAKQEMLDVAAQVLIAHGAVSEATVTAMAEGAIKRSDADLAVAVSGIAGPAGGTQERPVGTVCFAWAAMDDSGLRIRAAEHHFAGDREAVRRWTAAAALEGLLDL